jgi:hypothetical protein
LIVALSVTAFGIACNDKDKKTTVGAAEEVFSTRVPAAPPPPPPAAPAPITSSEPKKIEVPHWVDEYANVLCKRVAVCREKMLSALAPQQKAMLAMQIPSQEACLKNTRTFKDKAPKPVLDDTEKSALASCIRDVPNMACGNIQTGKVPECQTIAALIAEAQGNPSAGATAAPR